MRPNIYKLIKNRGSDPNFNCRINNETIRT